LATTTKKDIPQPRSTEQQKMLALVDKTENFRSIPDEIKTNSVAVNPSTSIVTPVSESDKGINNNSGVTKSTSQTLHNGSTDENPTDDVAADNSGSRKVRGIFRRATRFIERTTKLNPANEDGKLLIGSVAVSLK
jgi:hypothetical protein